MFKGQFNHTIDAKGRVSVPAKLKAELGDNFVTTKGFDGCLYAYSLEGWERFERKFAELPLGNVDARNMTRFFLAGAADCEIDKQGRCNIPQYLRDFAKLEKDVVFVGAGSHVEIWNEEIWNKNCTEYDSNLNVNAMNMANAGLLF